MSRAPSTVLAGTLVLALSAACTPDVPRVNGPSAIVALFDPMATPETRPFPDAVDIDEQSGLFNLAVPRGSTPGDVALIEWENQLQGAPETVIPETTIAGEVDPVQVNASNARVVDLSTGGLPVAAVVDVTYDAQTSTSRVRFLPTGGRWERGHTYAVALLGNASGGIVSMLGAPLVSSPAFALVKAQRPLVVCPSEATCHVATHVLGAPAFDSEARTELALTAALRLERHRLFTAPVLQALEQRGIDRNVVAVAWSFRVADAPVVVDEPLATPPVVAMPNDLYRSDTTGRLTLPIDPGASVAEQEFVSEYLNRLNGFPPDWPTSVQLAGPSVDAATVTAGTVLIDVLTGPPFPGPPSVSYSVSSRRVQVAPSSLGFGKGRTLLVALVGGARGIQGLNGQALAASQSFALMRARGPLVTCEDVTSPACVPTVTRLHLSTPEALQLEKARQRLQPALARVEARFGVPRANLAALWTFTTLDQPQLQFSRDQKTSAFPDDAFRNSATGKLSVAVSSTPNRTIASLVAGVNQLDGFSTLAPISVGWPAEDTLDTGRVDATGLDSVAGFVGPAGEALTQFVPCVGCGEVALFDGGTSRAATNFLLVPTEPFAEHARISGYVTTSLKDSLGRVVAPSLEFALARLSAPLLVGTRSTISYVSDALAADLEPTRQRLKPTMDSIEALGVPRRAVSLAWTFTTGGPLGEVKALNALANTSNISTSIDSLKDITTTISAPGVPYPTANLAAVEWGTLTLPDTLVGAQEQLDKNSAHWRPQKTTFVLSVPAAQSVACPTCPLQPAGGWPVALFLHTYRGTKDASVRLANALAEVGIATLAVDLPWHGDRSICTGSGAALVELGQAGATDDDACADPLSQRCNPSTGRCERRPAASTPVISCDPFADGDAFCFTNGLGFCLRSGSSGQCEGADFKRVLGAPRVSGWNALDATRLPGTRDALLASVVDVAHLVRILNASDPRSLRSRLLAITTVDPTRIHLVGQGLGGIGATLAAASSNDISRVVLNATPSDPIATWLGSDASEVRGFTKALAEGFEARPVISTGQAVALARTLFDGVDPATVLLPMLDAVSPTRGVFLQSVEQDPISLDFSTGRLVALASRAQRAPSIRVVMPATNLAPSERHAFLTNFADSAVTTAAQAQVASFLATGAVR